MSERALAKWKWILPTLLILALHGSGWVMGWHRRDAVNEKRLGDLEAVQERQRSSVESIAGLHEKMDRIERQNGELVKAVAEIDRKLARLEGRLESRPKGEAALLR